MAAFPPLSFVPLLSYKLYLYTLYAHPLRFIITTLCTCLLRHRLEEKLQTKIYFCSLYVYLYSYLSWWYFFLWIQITVYCHFIST